MGDSLDRTLHSARVFGIEVVVEGVVERGLEIVKMTPLARRAFSS
jgi:hypothetical protein